MKALNQLRMIKPDVWSQFSNLQRTHFLKFRFFCPLIILGYFQPPKLVTKKRLKRKCALNKKKPGNYNNKTVKMLASRFVDSFDHLKTIYNEVKIGIISQIKVLKQLEKWKKTSLREYNVRFRYSKILKNRLQINRHQARRKQHDQK